MVSSALFHNIRSNWPFNRSLPLILRLSYQQNFQEAVMPYFLLVLNSYHLWMHIIDHQFVDINQGMNHWFCLLIQFFNLLWHLYIIFDKAESVVDRNFYFWIFWSVLSFLFSSQLRSLTFFCAKLNTCKTKIHFTGLSSPQLWCQLILSTNDKEMH